MSNRMLPVLIQAQPAAGGIASVTK